MEFKTGFEGKMKNDFKSFKSPFSKFDSPFSKSPTTHLMQQIPSFMAISNRKKAGTKMANKGNKSVTIILNLLQGDIGQIIVDMASDAIQDEIEDVIEDTVGD